MGLVMSAASGFSSCLAAIGCSCLTECIKAVLPTGYTPGKVYALILFFATVITALILRSTEPHISTKYFSVECPTDDSVNGISQSRCNGFQAVYRVSFVDFFFYLAMAIASKCYVPLHSYGWGLKYLIYIGSLIGMFFVDNKVFNGYVHLARIASVVYLVAQVVTLVNCFYHMHEVMSMRWEEAEKANDEVTVKTYKGAYLMLSVLSVLAALTGIGLLYAYYGDCKLSQFWISITLIAGIISIICSLIDRVNMGLLTPSLLFLYLVYMCWSAILSNPNPQCNTSALMTSSKASNWNTVASLVFMALSLTYTGWSTYQTITGQALEADNTGNIQTSPPSASMQTILTGADGGKASPAAPVATPDEKKGDEMTPSEETESRLIWLFHLLMALAGAYMAMAITNWGNPEGAPNAHDSTVGTESMWLKIVAQWLTIILYQWSLWAPVCRGES